MSGWSVTHRTASIAAPRLRHPIEAYCKAIHEVVEKSDGRDWHTGKPLEWNRFNHEKPRSGGQHNHRIIGHYPTVDHYFGRVASTIGLVQNR